MEVIKRIVPRKDFKTYIIPNSFGEKAEVFILTYQEEKNMNHLNESFSLMQAREHNVSMRMLNEPEEDTWNDC